MKTNTYLVKPINLLIPNNTSLYVFFKCGGFFAIFFFLFLFPVAMRETKEALENVSSSLEVLQEGTVKLRASLSEERASLSNTLSDPACTNGAVSHTCNSIRGTLSQLGASADFSKVLRNEA